MIIDKILDRKDGELYKASDFYLDCLNYGKTGDKITARTMKEIKAKIDEIVKGASV